MAPQLTVCFLSQLEWWAEVGQAPALHSSQREVILLVHPMRGVLSAGAKTEVVKWATVEQPMSLRQQWFLTLRALRTPLLIAWLQVVELCALSMSLRHLEFFVGALTLRVKWATTPPSMRIAPLWSPITLHKSSIMAVLLPRLQTG
jgi:hypothetical protein